MIQLIARIWYNAGILSVDISPNHQAVIQELVRRIGPGQAKLEITKYYKLRSTGWKSQSHHINGHIQQIAQETGNDFDTVKIYCKNAAISHGYPIDMLNGMVFPWSETRIDVLQAALLIDQIHQTASELGINLRED